MELKNHEKLIVDFIKSIRSRKKILSLLVIRTIEKTLEEQLFFQIQESSLHEFNKISEEKLLSSEMEDPWIIHFRCSNDVNPIPGAIICSKNSLENAIKVNDFFLQFSFPLPLTEISTKEETLLLSNKRDMNSAFPKYELILEIR